MDTNTANIQHFFKMIGRKNDNPGGEGLKTEKHGRKTENLEACPSPSTHTLQNLFSWTIFAYRYCMYYDMPMSTTFTNTVVQPSVHRACESFRQGHAAATSAAHPQKKEK